MAKAPVTDPELNEKLRKIQLFDTGIIEGSVRYAPNRWTNRSKALY